MFTAVPEDALLLGRLIRTNAFVTVALTFFGLCPAGAAEQDCMSSYYRTKSPACVDEVIGRIGRLPPNAKRDLFVGFLAQVFRDSPQERERILRGETSGLVKVVALMSLYVAGLDEEAKRFATAINLQATIEKLALRPSPTLDDIRPSSLPGDNDLLIGAYMASGNTAFIQKILSNYTSADDGMVSDGLRIGFMMSKFGPNLTPKGREPVTMQAACTRYQCKTDPTKLYRIMTLSSATWALQSLAAKDSGIKKTLVDFFEVDARLKSLSAAERRAFGNYLAAIVAVTALQNGHNAAEQDRAFTAMSKAASIYENLGPPNEVFAPMAPFKTK
jgi:hypothetical protein